MNCMLTELILVRPTVSNAPADISEDIPILDQNVCIFFA